MQERNHIIDCYNKTAKSYADRFLDELSKKHLDRILLQSFAAENKDEGRMIDLGCGPGQTTKFLADCGVADILGIDISEQMIEVAKAKNPQLNFEVADILQLKYADQSFGSAIAFYAVVHFGYEQIRTAFSEIKRILTYGGKLLFSFHVGNTTVHLDTFFDCPVNIDFYFFETAKVVNLLTETGFEIIDVIERQAYRDVEHPSQRAYVWAKKSS